MIIKNLTLLTACLILPGLTADFELASPFQNGMVLQRDKPAVIWGWAPNATKVSVSINGKSGEGTTGSNGKWKVNLPPLQSGGPYKLVFVNGGNTITLTDVLVGDVWLAFGQSNMVRPLRDQIGKEPYIEYIDNGNPPIRCLQVERAASGSPRDKTAMSWKKSGSSGWVAIGAVFAVEMHKKMNVPTGIIWSAYGSSAIEEWMPAEMKETFPQAFRSVDNKIPMEHYNAMIHPLHPYTMAG